MLIRVRKEDVRAESWVKPDGLDTCLECWRDWIGGDPDRNLGTKTMRGLIGNSDGYGNDPAEEQQARNVRIAAATDAMIDSLSRVHIWAIYTMCGVSPSWDCPGVDILDIGMAAKSELEKKLQKNSCTSILF